MHLNDVASDFTFIGSTINNLELKNNIIALDDDATKNVNMDIDVSTLNKLKDEIGPYTQACVQLTLDIHLKNPSNQSTSTPATCTLRISVDGCFITRSIDDQTFNNMLYINGGSTLYSIARSHVLTISSQAFMEGKILLPLVNMVEFVEEYHCNSKK